MPPPPLIGQYPTPRVRRGQRVHCRYRGKVCRVSSFTDAPIPWPRCQPVGQIGGSGLWVNVDLERAIRTESAVALKHWFGVSQSCVNTWRRWAGVEGHDTTPGTRTAVQAAADAGAEAVRGKELPDAACVVRARNAKRLKLIEYARAKRWPAEWTAEQGSMLCTKMTRDWPRNWASAGA